MKIYLVGGAVRDQLLGKPVQDKDYVVVGSTPEEMLALGYQQVGREFPVFLHPETRAEYALARTERKSGRGYGGFEVHAAQDVTLEEDLMRRDITINAIAQDENGKLIDPCGGLDDLKKKVLRHVSDAFIEDPLRVLRVARFHARLQPLGFAVADETMNRMRDITATGELADLVPERVWIEISKALMEISPSQFFLTLKDCGALQVLLPEVFHLFGVPQRADYHPEIDTGVHTMMVLEQAAKMQAELSVRFAALTHDLGKADTPQDILPKHIGHEKKSLPHINNICRRFKVPKDIEKLARLVAEYHGVMHRITELKPVTLLQLLERLDAFRNSLRLKQFIQTCKADSLGRTGFENNDYPQANYLLDAFESCTAVDAKEFVQKGLKGQAISQAIRERRIQVIKMFKQDWEHSH